MSTPAMPSPKVASLAAKAQLGWLLFLPALILGPSLLRPGYLLTFDMVWVPQLSMRPSFWGFGSGWPRAVPSDTVIGLADNVIPGMVLQRVILYAALALAGIGIARLVRSGVGLGVLPGAAAATFYVWNPFIAERLTIGHWPVLLGYAVLPWVLQTTLEIRTGQPRWGHLSWWVWLGSLSASAGLVTAGLALIALWRRGRWQANLRLVVIILAANSVWIVAGLWHWGLSTDPGGFRAFAAHGEGGLPVPLATLALGGIWNELVVPGSRTGVMAWVSLIVLQVPMLLALPKWWRGSEVWLRRPVLVSATISWLVAVLGGLLPTLAGQLSASVPMLGLFRDGSRYLAPLALLQALLLAQVMAWLIRKLDGHGATLAIAMACLPVVMLPDLAWGAMGKLQPTNYPVSFASARQAVSKHLSDPGEKILILPFTSYRAPDWNRHWPVLDPMGRYLPQDFITNDALQISGKTVRGEDPAVVSAIEALAAPSPQDRANQLADLGVVAVVRELDAGTKPESVAGQVVWSDQSVELILLEDTDQKVTKVRSSALMPALLGAWGGFFGLLAFALSGVLFALIKTGRRFAKSRD
ncbi:MAG TPA: hypothetical protein P5108_07050 [Marmoricola sp.]|nr:hypothetical protein [Marmoricola sp.]HRV69193.1 hypothetical protein [Marmoricola sp.]